MLTVEGGFGCGRRAGAAAAAAAAMATVACIANIDRLGVATAVQLSNGFITVGHNFHNVLRRCLLADYLSRSIAVQLQKTDCWAHIILVRNKYIHMHACTYNL